MLGNLVVNHKIVGNARFVNVRLQTRRFGEIGISIVLNTFARFVSQKYGLAYSVQFDNDAAKETEMDGNVVRK